ncbi:MAG: phosphatidylglycerophosphatase A [Muribaculaceae bacterium]|nr:phosphatidylglycerophosphatase A [Muribaculaceae bacterium]
MSDNNNHPLGEAPWFHVILSTGLGTGFCPGAPGTVGAFLGLLIWYGLSFLVSVNTLFWITLLLVVATTVVGAWTSKVMERYWGEDPRTVVIDEFVGTWIPCLVAGVAADHLTTAILGLFGFAMFRVIDIVKTPMCRRLERVPDGWGVMLDDVLAGTYALILTLILRFILTGSLHGIL